MHISSFSRISNGNCVFPHRIPVKTISSQSSSQAPSQFNQPAPRRVLFEPGVCLDSGPHRSFLTDPSVWVQLLQECCKLSHCLSPDLRTELNTHHQQILTGSLRLSVNIFESFHIFSFKLRVSMSILTPSKSLVAAFLTLNDLKKDKKRIKVDSVTK